MGNSLQVSNSLGHLVRTYGLKYFGKISEFVFNTVKKRLDELDGKEGT